MCCELGHPGHAAAVAHHAHLDLCSIVQPSFYHAHGDCKRYVTSKVSIAIQQEKILIRRNPKEIWIAFSQITPTHNGPPLDPANIFLCNFLSFQFVPIQEVLRLHSDLEKNIFAICKKLFVFRKVHKFIIYNQYIDYVVIRQKSRPISRHVLPMPSEKFIHSEIKMKLILVINGLHMQVVIIDITYIYRSTRIIIIKTYDKPNQHFNTS